MKNGPFSKYSGQNPVIFLGGMLFVGPFTRRPPLGEILATCLDIGGGKIYPQPMASVKSPPICRVKYCFFFNQ